MPPLIMDNFWCLYNTPVSTFHIHVQYIPGDAKHEPSKIKNSIVKLAKKELIQISCMLEVINPRKFPMKGLSFTSLEGVCTDDLLPRKPGFLLSAMRSRTIHSVVFCRSLGFLVPCFLVPWFCSLAAIVKSDLACFVCYVWRRGGWDFISHCPLICLNVFFAMFNFDKT
jgi:hypothetical protein